MYYLYLLHSSRVDIIACDMAVNTVELLYT